jgi:hypothetical protein
MDNKLDESLPTIVIFIEDGAVQQVIGNTRANVLISDLDEDAEEPQSLVMHEVEECCFDDVDLFNETIAQWEAMEMM